ncbi:putative cytoplasmic protein [Xylariaceae sp. FL1019]|nr:putative cytoplasmic protein [Xylariaceae sp. FL1019]
MPPSLNLSLRQSTSHYFTPYATQSYLRSFLIVTQNTKRLQSTATAQDAAAQLLERFKDRKIVRHQVLDGNQIQKLALTLGRRGIHPTFDIRERPPAIGTPIPPGWHLVYFTPNGIEQKGDLGADGSDIVFNSPEPFTRRMWAGGKMIWGRATEDGTGLKVGDEVTETTELLSAVPKTSSATGAEMVFVEVKKTYSTRRGQALEDRRSWVFRAKSSQPEEMDSPKTYNASYAGPSEMWDEPPNAEKGPFPLRNFRWSPVGLFRFSALTFNGHKIHYNEQWARDVEGHPLCVVHGPLNLICMLDYWHDSGLRERNDLRRLREITYRAKAPLYEGEHYTIGMDHGTPLPQSHNRVHDITIRKNGAVCMSAVVHSDFVTQRKTGRWSPKVG